MEVSVRRAVADASQVGDARRGMAELARRAGLDETGVGRVALVTTELATNLSRHSRGGEVVGRLLAPAGPFGGGVEILALDRGPGIPDLPRAMRDGWSSGTSRGEGLGAVMRCSDRFDVHTAPGTGTAILARVVARPAAAAPAVEVAGVCLGHPRETACGDRWAVHAGSSGATVLVIDGLGHGPGAEAAAEAGMAAFEAAPGAAPEEHIGALHQAMRHTRGGAVGVLELDAAARRARFAGVGNVTGAIVGPARRRGLATMNGTVGVDHRPVRVFEYEWPDADLVVVHSDGCRSRWEITPYPGLAHRDPALVAGVLWRDYARVTDDVTVVVARGRPPAA
jgi:anti-sigma regulatory factor (Ser/Thr protein kinase)